MIWTLGDFNSVYLLTGGQPADQTHVLATLGLRYLRLDQVDMSLATVVCAMPLVLPLVYFMMKTAVAMTGRTTLGRRSRDRGEAAADRHPGGDLDAAADLPPGAVRALAEGAGGLRQALARAPDAAQLLDGVPPAALTTSATSGVQMWNSVLIAVAVGAITLFIATSAAFAISRLRVKGGGRS